MSKTGILKSSLSKKYAMAFTGLFLCLFLVGHLLGNLQLFASGPEGQSAFNEYAEFMTTNPLIKVMSYLTYASILFHVLDGFVLTLNNRKARPVKYVVEKGKLNSSWASRNMALLGTILLVFIVTHMNNFWYVMHFGEIPMVDGLKDLHTITLAFFNPQINSLAAVMTLLYVFAMISMGFHLNHGFQSAFQSLGLNHPKYTPVIKFAGTAFSVIVPAGFASLPIYLFLIQS
ncbi:MAG: succinate dehydrogenase [Bacteroidetes bacterium]|nr:MAG: succinate dehydrogenase [Bacteroidota bacterium]